MTNANSIISSIDGEALGPVVRRLLGRKDAEITEWQARALGGGMGNPVSLGVYRFDGAAGGADPVKWSVVLKLLQSPANAGWANMGEGEDPSHWNYWKRELLVYRSGILDTLPPGLAAPRCYGSEELPGDVAALWLEDLGELPAMRWSLEGYASAARHLGRLNGAYASPGAQPAFPWLGRGRHQQWLATREIQGLRWDHPLVAARYPNGAKNAFRRMLADSELFVDKLSRVGLTLSHGDTYPTNLVLRALPGGGQELVALDWALVGLEPVGTDLGQLAFGALNGLQDVASGHVIESLFEAYLDGLRDAGCKIDPMLARFGFVASAAFRIGLFQLVMLSFQISDDLSAVADGVVPAPGPDPFEVSMAEQAYRLLELL